MALSSGPALVPDQATEVRTIGTLRRDPPAPRGARSPSDTGRVRVIDPPDESVARSAGEKLADMDRRFRLFVESVRDYAIFMLDPAGRDEHGNLQGFGNVTQDLTERKQAEEALGALAGRLVHAQDRERQRVATSLSDSTSPSFVALLSKLYQVRKRTDGTTAQLTD